MLKLIMLMISSILMFNMGSNKKVTLLWSMMITFIMLLTIFQKSVSSFSTVSFYYKTMNFNSLMIMVSVWVSITMILISMKYYYMKMKFKMFTNLTMILLLITTLFFSTDNMLWLYITFEASLLPTLILIIKWGYQPERMQSSFYFMMYTICASLPLLVMVTKMKENLSSLCIQEMAPMNSMMTISMKNMSFLALTMAFMVKIPMWSVHLWLPKAHVEAPVSGSMVLAGVLLKLGGWGLIQVLKMNYILVSKMKTMLLSISLWGSLITGLICLSSVDMKSLIAYSSVIHMNVMIAGILSNSYCGLMGSMVMMIAHGISSPGMFAMSYMTYEMSKTRNLMIQKGVMTTQSKMLTFWFILAAANMAAPPSINLLSEIMIFTSVMKMGFGMAAIALTVTFFSATYNLFLYSSQVGTQSKVTLANKKMTSVSMTVMTTLSLPVFFMIMSLHLI